LSYSVAGERDTVGAMVPDPTPWGVELAKVAERLEAKTKQTRWTDRTDVLIERDFIVGAYVVRKLLGCHPASVELRNRRIPIRRLQSDYDLALSRRDSITIADLCNRLVRNTVFEFYCGETADLFDGVYVASDCEDENVILVIASDFIALCDDIVTEIV
jgi:hypothetical protein